MKPYDPSLPLFSIHIPKTAGTSVKQTLRQWYGPHLYTHYYQEKKALMPPKRSHLGGGDCIHGHFNARRGFGIQDYYPQATQFITFIREPLEILISYFWYMKRLEGKEESFRDGQKVSLSQSLESFLEEETKKEHHHPDILDYLPPLDLTLDNFRKKLSDNFIWIGTCQNLDHSLSALSDRLGKDRIPTQHLNPSKRLESAIPDSLRKTFEQKNELAYAIYRFAQELNTP